MGTRVLLLLLLALLYAEAHPRRHSTNNNNHQQQQPARHRHAGHHMCDLPCGNSESEAPDQLRHPPRRGHARAIKKALSVTRKAWEELKNMNHTYYRTCGSEGNDTAESYVMLRRRFKHNIDRSSANMANKTRAWLEGLYRDQMQRCYDFAELLRVSSSPQADGLSPETRRHNLKAIQGRGREVLCEVQTALNVSGHPIHYRPRRLETVDKSSDYSTDCIDDLPRIRSLNNSLQAWITVYPARTTGKQRRRKGGASKKGAARRPGGNTPTTNTVAVKRKTKKANNAQLAR